MFGGSRGSPAHVAETLKRPGADFCLPGGGGVILGLPEVQVTHPPTQADAPTHSPTHPLTHSPTPPPPPGEGGGVSHPSFHTHCILFKYPKKQIEHQAVNGN